MSEIFDQCVSHLINVWSDVGSDLRSAVGLGLNSDVRLDEMTVRPKRDKADI